MMQGSIPLLGTPFSIDLSRTSEDQIKNSKPEKTKKALGDMTRHLGIQHWCILLPASQPQTKDDTAELSQLMFQPIAGVEFQHFYKFVARIISCRYLVSQKSIAGVEQTSAPEINGATTLRVNNLLRAQNRKEMKPRRKLIENYVLILQELYLA